MEGFRIQQPEHSGEGIVAENPILQLQKGLQKILLRLAKQGHVAARLPATQQGAQGYYQDVVQRVMLALYPPWILQRVEYIASFPHHSFLHPVTSACFLFSYLTFPSPFMR